MREAWQEIPAEMAMKSFKTCGISNASDGTENDELYAEEGQEIDDVEDNEFETDSESESDACRCRVNCIVSLKLHTKRLLLEPPIL